MRAQACGSRCGHWPALPQHLAQQVRPVRQEPVDAEVEQRAASRLGSVDRPDVHLAAVRVRRAAAAPRRPREPDRAGAAPGPRSAHVQPAAAAAPARAARPARPALRRAEDVALGHRRAQPRRRRRAGPRRATPARSRRCTPGARPVAASTAASVGATTAAGLQLDRDPGVRQRVQHLASRGIGSRPRTRTFASSAAVCAARRPVPSVVRSSSASWCTTATPSALACTSSSR